MNILLIAPQPFYQERGTPIAVDLLVQHLSKSHTIDLLVYNEGESRDYTNVTLHRVNAMPSVTGIKPGFSLKKIYLNYWLFFKTLHLLIKNRYDVVHAVEESAFIALAFKPFFQYKFVQDIDSNMTTQIIDKAPALKLIRPVLRWLESLPMRFADCVVPVCESLAEEVRCYRQNGVFLLKDIALTDSPQSKAFSKQCKENVRSFFPEPELPLFMYIGNLASYQGIDLLINSFSLAQQNANFQANLIFIGGEEKDIQFYKKQYEQKQLHSHLIFAGKRPVAGLDYFMKQADVLVSPRTQGNNTPMKIYSYLASGKPVLATRLTTHTQVMNSEIAMLADPYPAAFAKTMQELINTLEHCDEMTQRAVHYIEAEHSEAAFAKQLNRIYNTLS